MELSGKGKKKQSFVSGGKEGHFIRSKRTTPHREECEKTRVGYAVCDIHHGWSANVVKVGKVKVHRFTSPVRDERPGRRERERAALDC